MEKTGALLKTTGSRVRGNAFRLDINALRALSVVAVLGYHLRIPGFAGGFVGVDVFLVITGYLMTGKVLDDLSLDRFSFLAFFTMRMRRIYPALAVVIISSAVAGWFVTLPGEYLRHLRQASYALIFVSNFAFDNDNGYFAMAAQTKPLLHTWSLFARVAVLSLDALDRLAGLASGLQFEIQDRRGDVYASDRR